MCKRIWYIYLLVFALSSCDYFVLKKQNREELREEEWSKLNLHEVEEPPLFKTCKYKSNEALQLCFQHTITTHIQNHLADHTIQTTKAINDTIWIPLLITKDGEIIIEKVNLPHIIQTQIPDFKTILEESIHTLPQVEPAHTRGTEVTVRYKLPLVIHVN